MGCKKDIILDEAKATKHNDGFHQTCDCGHETLFQLFNFQENLRRNKANAIRLRDARLAANENLKGKFKLKAK